MRVATCTPVDFTADTHFFGRDSGLLCRGFQMARVLCVSVMPGTASQTDAPDLARCSPAELTNAGWWNKLGVDLVVHYAWGDPAHRPVADPIQQAGIRLIQSLDTAGLTSPYGGTLEWWKCLIVTLAAPQALSSRLRHLAKAMRDISPGLYENRRLAMINQSDRVGSVSPAADFLVGLLRFYRRDLSRQGLDEGTPYPLRQPPCPLTACTRAA